MLGYAPKQATTRQGCEPWADACVGFVRYLGRDGVEEHCRRLVEEAGVLLLPSSLFASGLLPVPQDRFRVGFGRRDIKPGLDAWQGFLEAAYGR